MIFLEVINKDKFGYLLMKLIKVLKKISYYVYLILLIVFSVFYFENINVLLGIVIFLSICLIVWFIIDINRMIRR